jgi:hypothetical protein
MTSTRNKYNKIMKNSKRDALNGKLISDNKEVILVENAVEYVKKLGYRVIPLNFITAVQTLTIIFIILGAFLLLMPLTSSQRGNFGYNNLEFNPNNWTTNLNLTTYEITNENNTIYNFTNYTYNNYTTINEGFNTNQNDELNTTGNPTFSNLNINGDLQVKNTGNFLYNVFINQSNGGLWLNEYDEYKNGFYRDSSNNVYIRANRSVMLIFNNNGEIISQQQLTTPNLKINISNDYALQIQKTDGANIFRVDSTNDVVYTGRIRPRGDTFYNIGETGNRYKNLFLSGNISLNEMIHINQSGGKIPSIPIGTGLLIQRNDLTTRASGIMLLGGKAGNSQINFADEDNAYVGRILYEHSDDFFTFRINGTSDKVVFRANGQIEATNYLGSGANLTDILKENGGNSINGQQDFNNGWTSGGLSIIDGDIYAQTGYFYNITGLNVNTLSVNGSLIPSFDNAFDIGSSSLRYKDLSLSGAVNSNSITTVNGIFSGNVAMGVASASARLDVIGTANPVMKVRRSGGSTMDIGFPTALGQQGALIMAGENTAWVLEDALIDGHISGRNARIGLIAGSMTEASSNEPNVGVLAVARTRGGTGDYSNAYGLITTASNSGGSGKITGILIRNLTAGHANAKKIGLQIDGIPLETNSYALYIDTLAKSYFKGNVGIGTLTPTSLLSVGSSNEFQIDSNGNIVKINDVTTSFPSSQGSVNSVLTNDGSGSLSWVAPTIPQEKQLLSSAFWTFGSTTLPLYEGQQTYLPTNDVAGQGKGLIALYNGSLSGASIFYDILKIGTGAEYINATIFINNEAIYSENIPITSPTVASNHSFKIPEGVYNFSEGDILKFGFIGKGGSGGFNYNMISNVYGAFNYWYYIDDE